MPASLKHLTNKRISYYSLLARWKDGLYYTAALLKCDKSKRKCLVCFEDGSEVWANNRDLHLQLSLDQMNEDEDIVCCICDEGNSEQPNYIILCDVCQQGYHQKCHNPPVDSSTIDASDDTSDHKDWICATCSYILRQKDRVKLGAVAAVAQQQKQNSPSISSSSSTATTSSQAKKSNDLAAPQPPQQTRTRHIATPEPTTTTTNTKATNQKTTPITTPVSASTTATAIPREPTVATAPAVAPSHPPPSQPQLATTTTPVVTPPATAKPAAKVKQTPTVQERIQKSTIGPIKGGTVCGSPQQQQKQAPYYPLTSQVRAGATTSTAALASMTASSALVVGSSAGRTKQDLVNQSNRSSQRQRQVVAESTAAPPGAPSKHAVRKSSVNFAPVRQSALPTATRTPPPVNNNIIVQQKAVAAPAGIPLALPLVAPGTAPTTTAANLIASTASIAPAVSLTPIVSPIINRQAATMKPQSIIMSQPVRINPINSQSVAGSGDRHVGPGLAVGGGGGSLGGGNSVVVMRPNLGDSTYSSLGKPMSVLSSSAGSIAPATMAPALTTTGMGTIRLSAPIHVGHQTNNNISGINNSPLRNGGPEGASGASQPTGGAAPAAASSIPTKPSVIVSGNSTNRLGNP